MAYVVAVIAVAVVAVVVVAVAVVDVIVVARLRAPFLFCISAF